MVKGISRRVVVVESPDRRYFEQAIFLVRSGAESEGVTSRELVDEAKRVARDYAAGQQRSGKNWREWHPAIYALLGGGGIGALWLLASLL